MIKLLIGGSPCTYWSIAQTKNRETTAEGVGWELFKNFLIALEKYKPDYFLYENNKSMSTAIREQITGKLGVEPIMINSALVSAQNRQRLYWVGKRNPDGAYSRIDISQPEDRNIMLRDILEHGTADKEKAYCLKHQAGNTRDYFKKHHTQIAFEPIRIGTIESDAKVDATIFNNPHGFNKGGIKYDKTPTLTANGNWQHNNFVIESADGKTCPVYMANDDPRKTNCLSIVQKDSIITQAIPDIVEKRGYLPEMFNAYNRAEITDKAPTLTTGSMATSSCAVNRLEEVTQATSRPIYEVKDGQITIKGKQYPTRLANGFYIIRKLTVTECKRLQTVPDSYIFPVSDTQAYKMLGNGWTVDVIVHILGHIPGITEEKIEVFSMYDGMACGHIALDKLGAHITRYYATEIDKYAVRTATYNFSDIIQLGDAYQVRADDWSLQRGGAAHDI